MARFLCSYTSDDINKLSTEIQKTGIIDLTPFISTDRLKEIAMEAQDALKLYGKRKEFVSINGGNTPRLMMTVGKPRIDLTGNRIGSFYNDIRVRELISLIAGEPVNPIEYENEQYVINCLMAGGDTHGWHFDDYSYALVCIVEATPFGTGGCVEYIPNCNDGTHRANYNDLERIIKDSTTQQVWYPSQSIYLMRSLTTLHRVNPIQPGYRRVSIAMSYGIGSDIVQDHQNIVDLYS